MRRALAVCAAAILIALAGCGSGSTGAPADPATLAPPASLAYASFEIAPDGPQKDDFDAAFGKLLGPAPEARLGSIFTRLTQTSGRLDYLSDVRPWLGKQIAVAVTRVTAHDADFALLAASTDDDKARAAIDRDLEGTHKAARSYRGVAYDLLDDGTANGVVAHYLVAGREPAFKAVVDAAKDGRSLSGTPQWKRTVGRRGDGKAGLAYVDVKAVLQSAASSLPGAEGALAPLLLGTVELHPFVATLDAQPDKLVVDLSSPGTKPDARGPAAASTSVIESLPADTWFALGLPDVGQALSKLAAALRDNPLVASQYTRAVDRLRARTGLDADRDLLRLGDVALSLRGTAPLTTLTVDAPGATVTRLRRLAAAAGTEHPAQVAPPSRSARGLGTTPLFAKATAAIGSRPTLFADFGAALDAAAASPHHANDPRFERALPRLRHVEYVAAGARRDAGLDVARLVIGLR